MTASLNDLGSEILWCPAETVGAIGLLDALLGEAEVSYLNMSLSIKNDVLRLEVSIDYIFSMQGTNSDNHFCGIKFCALFIEPLLLPKVGE